jgi:hypothetical protein
VLAINQSKTYRLSHCPLVNVLAGIAKLLNCSNDNPLELVSPDGVEFINFLVLLNGELGQVAHEALGSLSVLFLLKSIVFHLLLPIFF